MFTYLHRDSETSVILIFILHLEYEYIVEKDYGPH